MDRKGATLVWDILVPELDSIRISTFSRDPPRTDFSFRRPPVVDLRMECPRSACWEILGIVLAGRIVVAGTGWTVANPGRRLMIL